MTISSARPDLLTRASAGVTAAGSHLEDAAHAVSVASAAFQDACPDRHVSISAHRLTRSAETSIHDLARHLERIAEAFRLADSKPATERLSVTTDQHLSEVISAHYGTLDSALTRPTRAAAARGRVDAHKAILAASRGGPAAAVEFITSQGSLSTDPVYLAALFNELGPERLATYVETLAADTSPWEVEIGPFRQLADAWATATRTLDQPIPEAHLEVDMINKLLKEPIGRNVLRALAGASGVRSGLAYLAMVLTPLLLVSAITDADVSSSYRFLTGPGRTSDPDVAFLNALSLTPGSADFLLTDDRTGATVAKRVRWLLDNGTAAQPAAVTIIRDLLENPALQPGSSTPLPRTEILRGVYDWVVKHGATEVTEPLAQLLADFMAEDLALFTARVDQVRGGNPGRVFEAIAQYEKPWLTTLLALETHSLQRIRATLHSPSHEQITAMDDFDKLADALEVAAAASDRPGPGSVATFSLLGLVVNPVTGALTKGANPVVGTLVGAGLKMALDEWQESTVPEAGDREERTRLERETLRRQVWVVIASDENLSKHLNWFIGGTDPTAPPSTGTSIKSVTDLINLTPSGEDLDEFHGWVDGQPRELQALVALYLEGC